MQLALQIRFYESPALTLSVCLLATLGGLIAGSVLHTLVRRMTDGESSFEGGARCDQCGHPLTLRESLPLVGWLSMKGVCPYCGEPLGLEATFIEILCAGVFTSLVLRHGMTIQTCELLAVACVLFLITLTCLKDYRIPNKCIVVAYLIRIAYLIAVFFTGGDAAQLAISSIVGGAALGIPLALALFLSNAMLDRDVVGMGTVKLVSVMGFYLGWQQGLLAMAGACLLLLFVGVVSPFKLQHVEVEGGAHRDPNASGSSAPSPRDLRATQEEDIAEPMRIIPFAPAIIIVFWVMLLIGVAPGTWLSPII